MKHIYAAAIILLSMVFINVPAAHADWTLNLGYHNPVGSTAGVNFLYFGQRWSFEFGIGWVDLSGDVKEKKDEEDEDADDDAKDEAEDKRVSVGGDLDLKYLFRSGFFRPYLQGGLGWGHSAVMGESDHGSAGIGGPFVGAGIFLGGPKFYVYGSAVAGSSRSIGIQAGLGFDI